MNKTDNTFSVADADDSPGFLLWQVTNLWQREIKKALEKYELTHSQYVLMASIHWLSLGGQPVTQIILSAHTKIDPMTTSTVLRALQGRGMVERQEHATDTRAKTVVLTDNGRKIVRLAVKAVEKFDGEFFGPLGEKTGEFNKKLLLLLKQAGK
jgi:MarR family transcriptional regulator, organic hydroperoxide resistance regulator